MSFIDFEHCTLCGKKLTDKDDYNPPMCCSGRDCGCMGMPTVPPICKKCVVDTAIIHKGIHGKD